MTSHAHPTLATSSQATIALSPIETILMEMDSGISYMEDLLCQMREAGGWQARDELASLEVYEKLQRDLPKGRNRDSTAEWLHDRRQKLNHYLPSPPNSSPASKARSAHSVPLPSLRIPSFSDSRSTHDGIASSKSIKSHKRHKWGQMFRKRSDTVTTVRPLTNGPLATSPVSMAPSRHGRPHFKKASHTLAHLSTSAYRPDPLVALLDSFSEYIVSMRIQHTKLLEIVPPPDEDISPPGTPPANIPPPTPAESIVDHPITHNSLTDALKTKLSRSPVPSRDLPPPPDDDDDTPATPIQLERSILGLAHTSHRSPTSGPRPLYASHSLGNRSSVSSLISNSSNIWYDAEDGSNEGQALDEKPRALQATREAAKEAQADTPLNLTTSENATISAQKDQQVLGVPLIDPKRVVRRLKLPCNPLGDPGILTFVNANKSAFIRDPSKLSFPLEFNQPFSVLQKMAEDMEHCHFLNSAATTTDPIARAIDISAFAVAQYASSRFNTVRKPYNPMMGETYELYRPDMGCSLIAEKVSHEPVRTVSHAQGKGWTFTNNMTLHQKAYVGMGFYYDITPIGWQRLQFGAEEWHFNKPTTSLNMMSKKAHIVGDMHITSSSGVSVIITFKQADFRGRGERAIKGFVSNAAGKKVAFLDGFWDKELNIRRDSESSQPTCVWQVPPFPESMQQGYALSPFAVTLNEITGDLYSSTTSAILIAPTDSRLRPDQRMLEDGNVEDARRRKVSLENGQRTRRREKTDVVPKWFGKRQGDVGEQGEEEWEYLGGYWETRKKEAFGTDTRGIW
ncbi:hypothetical protein P7C73_g4867, partial [Tremellales sp. Uapishka_1]